MIKDMMMKKLIYLLFVFAFFTACHSDQINDDGFEEEIILNTTFGGGIHIRDVLDKRSANDMSTKEWQLIDAELNVMWMFHPELKKIVSHMLEFSSLKLKFKFNPKLASDAPAYYDSVDHTIYLKSNDYIKRDIILHEFIHAAQRAIMGEFYMSVKSVRNVEFEAAVMTDLLMKDPVLGSSGATSDAEKDEYLEWWGYLYHNDFSRLREFNQFAEKYPLYQHEKFDPNFDYSFLRSYWVSKDYEYFSM